MQVVKFKLTSEPIDVKAGAEKAIKDKDVGEKPPPIVARTGILSEVNATLVNGLKLPPTLVNEGNDIDVNAGLVLTVKAPPIVANTGKSNEVQLVNPTKVKVPEPAVIAVKLGKLTVSRSVNPFMVRSPVVINAVRFNDVNLVIAVIDIVPVTIVSAGILSDVKLLNEI